MKLINAGSKVVYLAISFWPFVPLRSAGWPRVPQEISRRRATAGEKHQSSCNSSTRELDSERMHHPQTERRGRGDVSLYHARHGLEDWEHGLRIRVWCIRLFLQISAWVGFMISACLVKDFWSAVWECGLKKKLLINLNQFNFVYLDANSRIDYPLRRLRYLNNFF